MKLEINIDETMFKDVVEKELEAVPQEDIQDIIKQSIKEYLIQHIEYVLFQTKSYSSEKEFTPIFKDALKDIDLSEPVKTVSDAMIQELKGNLQPILNSVLMSMMIDGLGNNWYFQETIKNTLTELLSQNR